jgi:hypothetical protein
MATKLQGKTALISSGSSNIDLATLRWEYGGKDGFVLHWFWRKSDSEWMTG